MQFTAKERCPHGLKAWVVAKCRESMTEKERNEKNSRRLNGRKHEQHRETLDRVFQSKIFVWYGWTTVTCVL